MIEMFRFLISPKNGIFGLLKTSKFDSLASALRNCLAYRKSLATACKPGGTLVCFKDDKNRKEKLHLVPTWNFWPKNILQYNSI